MSDDIADWTRLCDLLDDDPELAPAVHDADEDERWEALIGGLDDAGALAYLESDDTGMELADALPALPRVFRAGIDLSPVNDEDDLDAAIALADGILAPHGLTLIRLEEESDACALVAVPAENATAIIDLADTLGHAAHASS